MRGGGRLLRPGDDGPSAVPWGQSGCGRRQRPQQAGVHAAVGQGCEGPERFTTLCAYLRAHLKFQQSWHYCSLLIEEEPETWSC